MNPRLILAYVVRWPENNLFSFFFPLVPIDYQRGKFNFTNTYPSLHHCSIKQFPEAYPDALNIRVLASISHKIDPVNVHDPSVVWTSNITRTNFKICVLESGIGTNGSVIVNWVSFRGTPTGALTGTASFSPFTSGTKCTRVDFAKVWQSLRTVRITLKSHFVINCIVFESTMVNHFWSRPR